jgi:hypothetical protein
MPFLLQLFQIGLYFLRIEALQPVFGNKFSKHPLRFQPPLIRNSSILNCELSFHAPLFLPGLITLDVIHGMRYHIKYDHIF